MKSELINELAPTSAGVKEFFEQVRDTKGALKALGFKRMKDLESYVLDADYREFNDLRKELKKFLGETVISEQEKIEKLPKAAISLFRYLNTVKDKYKKKSELMDEINRVLKLLDMDEALTKYYTELYLANYRPDGRYDLLTSDDIVDPRTRSPWSISNPEAYKYTKAMIPFKGSNLKGQWEKDNKGVDMYVVLSYGWYPVFIFKKGIWYEVVDRYSSSTARQINNSDPGSIGKWWERDLNVPVYLADQDEMAKIRKSMTHDELIEYKKKKLVGSKKSLSQRMKLISNDPYSWSEDPEIRSQVPAKIKFKINDVEVIDGKLTMIVDVINVVKKVGDKGVDTPENYLKGQLPGYTKTKVEDSIRKNLKQKFKSYIGKRPSDYSKDSDEPLLHFKFNHLREKDL